MKPSTIRLPLVLASLALPLLTAVPAAAQGAPAAPGSGDLRALLSGKQAPLTLKLRELSPEWRRVTLRTPAEAPGEGSGFLGMMLGGMFGPMASGLTPSAPPVYTQGDTISLGGELYLIAYRPPKPALDLLALKRAAEQNAELPPPEVLRPDTELSLWLIQFRDIQSLGEIRPFNLDLELRESEKAAAAETALRKELMGGVFGGGAAPAAPEPEVFAEPALPEEAPAPKPAAKKPAPKKPAPKKR
ncbi:MAG: hypothetical protein ACK47B_12020 [Armatimonadota bacterium]